MNGNDPKNNVVEATLVAEVVEIQLIVPAPKRQSQLTSLIGYSLFQPMSILTDLPTSLTVFEPINGTRCGAACPNCKGRLNGHCNRLNSPHNSMQHKCPECGHKWG